LVSTRDGIDELHDFLFCCCFFFFVRSKKEDCSAVLLAGICDVKPQGILESMREEEL